MAEAATATYRANPTDNPIDFVRLEVGDTDCATAFLRDAEIEHYLNVESPNQLRAASRAADAIAAKLARRVDFGHGPVKKSASQARDHYLELARELMRRASTGQALAVSLADTKAEKAAADADSGAVQPNLAIGMQDNPRSGDQSADPADWNR